MHIGNKEAFHLVENLLDEVGLTDAHMELSAAYRKGAAGSPRQFMCYLCAARMDNGKER